MAIKQLILTGLLTVGLSSSLCSAGDKDLKSGVKMPERDAKAGVEELEHFLANAWTVHMNKWVDNSGAHYALVKNDVELLQVTTHKGHYKSSRMRVDVGPEACQIPTVADYGTNGSLYAAMVKRYDEWCKDQGK